MSGVARRWWPIGPADHARARSLLASVADMWASRWIVQPLELGFDAAAPEEGEHLPHCRAWHAPHQAELRLHAQGWQRLVRHALDMPPGSVLHGIAEDVAQALSQAMADDLAGLLKQGLGLTHVNEAAVAVRGSTRVRALLPDGTAWLTMTMDDDWLRGHAGDASPAVAHREPTSPRVAAMGDVRVQLSAMVGRCAVNAADVAHLAVGDVLVTSAPLDQPITLALSGQQGLDTPFATARPVRSGDATAVVIETITTIHSQATHP
jgi:flagellar motor switch/type III secretory pathway protein FliN